jgi:hypothetical protein
MVTVAPIKTNVDTCARNAVLAYAHAEHQHSCICVNEEKERCDAHETKEMKLIEATTPAASHLQTGDRERKHELGEANIHILTCNLPS